MKTRQQKLEKVIELKVMQTDQATILIEFFHPQLLQANNFSSNTSTLKATNRIKMNPDFQWRHLKKQISN